MTMLNNFPANDHDLVTMAQLRHMAEVAEAERKKAAHIILICFLASVLVNAVISVGAFVIYTKLDQRNYAPMPPDLSESEAWLPESSTQPAH